MGERYRIFFKEGLTLIHQLNEGYLYVNDHNGVTIFIFLLPWSEKDSKSLGISFNEGGNIILHNRTLSAKGEAEYIESFYSTPNTPN